MSDLICPTAGMTITEPKKIYQDTLKYKVL